LVEPGRYSVSLAMRKQGKLTEIAGPESFTVKSLPQGAETSKAPAELLAFQQKAGALYRAVRGASALAGELGTRIDHLKVAIPQTPGAEEALEQQLRAIEARLDELSVTLNGDRTVASRNEPVPWSVSNPASAVYNLLLNVRTDVPAMYQQSYDIAAEEFGQALTRLRSIETDLSALEATLEQLGAPHTPGRVPVWRDSSR